MMCWWATASPCLQLSGWSPGLRLWYWGGRQKYPSCKGRGHQNSERKQIKWRQIVLFKGPAQSPRIYTERRFNIQHTPLENTNQSPLHPQRAELMQTRPCEEGWGKRRERKTAPPGMRNLRLVTFWKNKPQLGLRRDRRLQTCASPFQTLLSGRWKLAENSPALEVSHHVPPLRNLGWTIQSHVSMLAVHHVLLQDSWETFQVRKWKIMQANKSMIWNWYVYFTLIVSKKICRAGFQ